MLILMLSGAGPVMADRVAVVVGNVGCVGRQQTVTKLWGKISGVESVTVLGRQSGERGPQRTFVIVSSGSSPEMDQLKDALGRKEEQFPILSCKAMDAEKNGK